MRKCMSTLFATTITVAGLAAGVTPAHATAKPEATLGWAYVLDDFTGPSVTMRSHANCELISLPNGKLAHSAENTSTASTIRLYSNRLLGCGDEIAVLTPGERDRGYDLSTGQPTTLGLVGAYYYSIS